MSRKQTRREARECAFSLVFQMETSDFDTDFLIEQLIEDSPECIINLDYIKTVLVGVTSKYQELDKVISAALPSNRAITRLSKVVLAILRLAVFEMKYVDDVPGKVAINEAVELAKIYAEDDAPAFVNGVLSGVISE